MLLLLLPQFSQVLPDNLVHQLYLELRNPLGPKVTFFFEMTEYALDCNSAFNPL